MQPPSERHLDTSNPEHILYLHDMVDIAILAGIRTDILDRMRVTLKIKVEHLSIRYNLDLYNSSQVDRLVRMVAEHLEIGTSIISAGMKWSFVWPCLFHWGVTTGLCRVACLREGVRCGLTQAVAGCRSPGRSGRAYRENSQ